MGKEIKLRINACYGDLRPSEKRAADYVLKHLDELKNLSLDKLAENAGVSQPTVMRMIKALGYGGYKEFRYTVVERLAAGSTNTAGFEAMYGYTLTGNENIEDIPAKIVATAGYTDEMMDIVVPEAAKKATVLTAGSLPTLSETSEGRILT